VDACVRAYKEGRKFRVIIIIPAIPGFAGDLRSDAAAGTRAIMDYQYKSLSRGEHSIFGQIAKAGADPYQYIFAFNLRSYDRINATPQLMKELKESDVSYQELQRAQAEEIAGESVHGVTGEGKSRKKRSGRNKTPSQPTDAKGLFKRKVDNEVHESSESESDAEERQQERQKGQKSAAEKKRRFQKYHEGAQGTGDKGKSEEHSTDSIAGGAMLDKNNPSNEYWAGRGEGDNDEKLVDTEKENFVQEELYIHAKVSDG